MGEVLESGGFEVRQLEVEIERLRAKASKVSVPDGACDHRALASAGLEVAQMALEAMREDTWPVNDAAITMGEALADAAAIGPEDQMMTICRPAEALVRAGHADWDHPAPDFRTVNTAIIDIIERSTGGAKGRHAPWTAPLFWETEPHHPSQAVVMLSVAPVVAEVAADLAQGKPTQRDPVAAIMAEINWAFEKWRELYG